MASAGRFAIRIASDGLCGKDSGKIDMVGANGEDETGSSNNRNDRQVPQRLVPAQALDCQLFRRALAAGSRNGCKIGIAIANDPDVVRTPDSCCRTNVRRGFRQYHHRGGDIELFHWARGPILHRATFGRPPK
jgi:hypothetical protein